MNTSDVPQRVLLRLLVVSACSPATHRDRVQIAHEKARSRSKKTKPEKDEKKLGETCPIRRSIKTNVL